MPTTIASSADMAVDGEEDKSNVAELEEFAIAQFGIQDTNCFFTADNLCLGYCSRANNMAGVNLPLTAQGQRTAQYLVLGINPGPGSGLDRRL